jgi:hypothetical protein
MASEGRSPSAAASGVPPNGDGPAVRRAQPNRRTCSNEHALLTRARHMYVGNLRWCSARRATSTRCSPYHASPSSSAQAAGGEFLAVFPARGRPPAAVRAAAAALASDGAMKGAVERRPTRGTLLVRGPVRDPCVTASWTKPQAADLVHGHVSGGEPYCSLSARPSPQYGRTDALGVA